MHSPVIVNYDPGILADDGDYSDWDYDEDDYYDDLQEERDHRKKRPLTEHDDTKVDALKPAKRKRGAQGPRSQKKRKIEAIEDIPDLSLGESIFSDTDEQVVVRPVVVWRTEDMKPDIPLIKDGEGEKVSLLKDWRERFKASSTTVEENSRSISDPKGPHKMISARQRPKQSTQQQDHNRGDTYKPASTKTAGDQQGTEEFLGAEAAQSLDNVAKTGKRTCRKRARETEENEEGDGNADKLQPLANATNATRVAKDNAKSQQSFKIANAEGGKGARNTREKNELMDKSTTGTRQSKRLRKE